MKFEAAFPGFREKVNESFERQKFMDFLGARLVTVEPGVCEIELDHRPELTQQHGFFHAGVISTLADNAAGYAAFSVMDESSSILTVEFKINLMSPGAGERLLARGEVVKHGKTLTICRTKVFVFKGETRKQCALTQSTLMQLANRSDEDLKSKDG